MHHLNKFLGGAYPQASLEPCAACRFKTCKFKKNIFLAPLPNSGYAPVAKVDARPPPVEKCEFSLPL